MRGVRFATASLILMLVIFGFEVWRTGLLSWLTPISAIGIIFLAIALHEFRKLSSAMASGLQISKSNLSESLVHDRFKKAKETETEMETAVSSIGDIGQDAFPELIKALHNNHIKESLLSAHTKISALRKNEHEKNWITAGVGAITGLKHKGSDIAEYAFQVISSVVKYLKANQGGFFIVREADSEAYFELLGSYAYGKKKYLDKRINLGDGLIGQVYYEKDIILLTDVPKDYVKITSGLGEALPRCICILPLLSDGKVYGALEIASFEKLRPFEIEYLKSVGETIGYNLMAIESHQRTEKLLIESQQMAQEVKTQERELRQNMEKLTATQEVMERERKQLETLSLVANHTNNSVLIADADGKIVYTNEGFLKLTGYTFAEVVGRKPGEFLQGPLTDKETVKRISAKLKKGEAMYEEILNYSKNGKAYWISLVINPIRNDQGKVEKFVSIQAEISDTKRKALDNEARLLSISKTNAVIEFNRSGQIVSVNDLFLKVTGFNDALLGKMFEWLLPEEERDKPQTKLMWENILMGQSFVGEFKYRSASDKVQWLSGTYNPVYDIIGNLDRILMVGQFVTQDKEKVQDLQEVVATVKSCFPMAEFNYDMTFKSANDLFLGVLGVKRLELKRLHLNEVVSTRSLEQIKKYLDNPTEHPESIEIEINRKEQLAVHRSRVAKINGQAQRKGVIILQN
jgi:PAS domain S-box-containing protein